MKKYLLPETGEFYKANLHCHSTVSDGKWTPERIKEEYTKRGYSVIAYTDHNVLLDHQDLTDDNFVALNGVEIDFASAKSEKERITVLYLQKVIAHDTTLPHYIINATGDDGIYVDAKCGATYEIFDVCGAPIAEGNISAGIISLPIPRGGSVKLS